MYGGLSDRCLSAYNHIQYLFGECDNDSASEGQEPVRSLARIMGLKRESHLHDAETKKYESYGSYQAKYEI